MEQCILDFYHQNLKCQLPWSKYVFDLEVFKEYFEKFHSIHTGKVVPDFEECNSSDEYLNFKELANKLSDASSTSFWNLVECTPRCKFTKYVLKPMVEGNFNGLLYETGKSEGANIEVSIP